jgi:hypothetical protein
MSELKTFWRLGSRNLVISVAAAMSVVIGLAACTSTDTTTAVGASASPSPDPPSETVVISALPNCAEIFSPAMLLVLGGENLQSVTGIPGSNPDLARYDASLEPVLMGKEQVTCDFVLPVTERGMSMNIFLVSDVDQSQVESFFAAAGYSVASPVTGVGTIYSFEHDGDYPFTEAHLIRDDLMVSSFDYFGVAAIDYVTDASAQIATVAVP